MIHQYNQPGLEIAEYEDVCCYHVYTLIILFSKFNDK